MEYVMAAIALAALGVSVWNTFKIRDVHLSLNSRLDAYLATVGREQHAAGVKEEKERQL